MRKGLPAVAGFTIIELIIVMLIMALFIGLGYSNFRDFAVRQNLNTAQRTVYDYLQEAKSLSAANKKPEDCVGTFEGWRFKITRRASPAEVSLYHVCEDSGDTLYKAEQLPQDIELNYTVSDSILFIPLGGLTDIPVNRSYNRIRVINRGFNSQYIEMRVYVIGKIETI